MIWHFNNRMLYGCMPTETLLVTLFLLYSHALSKRCPSLKVSVNYSKVTGKCMLLFSFIMHMSWETFSSPQFQKVMSLFSTARNNKFQGPCVENQPLWGVFVISVALEMTGSIKCTTAQLHISFDCQFVLCLARSFELRLKMKANLVHIVSTADCYCCLSAPGTIRTIFFFSFHNSVPCWDKHYA